MPGAVFFEMAALAGRCLLSDGVHTRLTTLAATGCAIAAPLLLLSAAGGAIVTCDVEGRSPVVRLSSVSGGKAAAARPAAVAATHLTATLAFVAQPQQPAPSQLLPVAHYLAGSRSARQALMVSAAAAAPAAADRGCAEVALDVATHGAGFVGHPVAVDACMHIAAALAEVWSCTSQFFRFAG